MLHTRLTEAPKCRHPKRRSCSPPSSNKWPVEHINSLRRVLSDAKSFYTFDPLPHFSPIFIPLSLPQSYKPITSETGSPHRFVSKADLAAQMLQRRRTSKHQIISLLMSDLIPTMGVRGEQTAEQATEDFLLDFRVSLKSGLILGSKIYFLALIVMFSFIQT